MKFNLKNYLATGAILAGSLVSGYSQDTLKTKHELTADSIMAEAKKYPTTIHYAYKIMKGSKYNFHNTRRLEKIIKSVERQHNKQKEYSKEEAVGILKTTYEAIKKYGPEVEAHKFDCDDFSRIYLAVGEKFNLPIHGVVAITKRGNGPGGLHFLVRYDPDGKHKYSNQSDSINEGDFNWEGMIGEIKPDTSYYSLPECFREANPHYMQSLTKRQIISDAYNQKSNFLWKKKNKNKFFKYRDISYKLGGISLIDPSECYE